MAILAKRAGTSPCRELYPGGLRGLQAPRGRGARAWQGTTTQCLRASRACTRARCRAALTGASNCIQPGTKTKTVSNPCSPGDGKAAEETPHYPTSGPPYAPCSQSPGAQAAAWSGNLGTGPQGPHPAYMGGEGHPSPQVSPNDPNDPIQTSVVQAHANSGAPAQQATPQAPLPSPLYPWMRSQFGRFCLFY